MASVASKYLEPLTVLPTDVQDFLRGLGKGIVFSAGGLFPPQRKVVLNLVAGTVLCNQTTDLALNQYEQWPGDVYQALAQEQLLRVEALFNTIWLSEKLYSRLLQPMGDFIVNAVMVDGDLIRVIESFGPPVDEVEQLYMLCGQSQQSLIT